MSQLAVVIASLARDRASLAIGNVVGSVVSNILGAFSIGLLSHNTGSPIEFDRSSRIYSLVLLVLTTFVTPILYFSTPDLRLACGLVLIISFVIYIACVGWAISKGSLTAPANSDSDVSSDDDSSDSESTIDAGPRRSAPTRANNHHHESSPLLESNEQTDHGVHTDDYTTPSYPRIDRRRRTLSYHISYLSFGFVAIGLAGYVLSHAATTITDEFEISDVLFGVVILAIATTLPEKFVAVMSGYRGHAGILVANTAGSNLFLLTLCSGVVLMDVNGKFERGNVELFELGVLWVSTAAFTATVWYGGRFHWWIGLIMLIAYISFIALEFTVIHNLARGD